MARYVLRRLALVVPTLGLVLLVVFVVLRITGDPAELFLEATAGPAEIAALRARLGLDDPLPVQFARFVWDLLRGDFGTSLSHQAPALPVVLERLGATLQLVAAALGLAVLLGIAGGLVAASFRDRLADHAISAVAVFGQSMPSFWLGHPADPSFRAGTRLAADVGLRHAAASGAAGADALGLPAAELHPGDAHRRAGGEARSLRHHGARQGRLARCACFCITCCRTR